jgi:TetR/AcrR family transcriptional regulator, tetracycline repressor protein
VYVVNGVAGIAYPERNNARKSMKSLDSDEIVEAAIAFIEENGLADLSMRRLAADLGVGTMTLYNHVPNKEALLNGVVQTILEEIETPGPDVKPWSERVRFILRSFRQVAHRHPSVVQLIPVNPPWTPPALRATEVGVAALKEAGFGDEDAAHAYRLLASYVVGYVSLELGGFFTMDETRVDADFPFHDFPNLLAAAPYLVSWDAEAEFDLGINVILSGLQDQLTRMGPSAASTL